MTILLAPSETKSIGGEGHFHLCNLSFNTLSRDQIVMAYEKCLENDLCIDAIFSTIKEKASDINQYKSQKTKKAILRYEGVAFEYLDYLSLSSDAKKYIHNNVYLFSNLYGIVRAVDEIPYYRLKQGAKIGTINPATYYKKHLNFLNDTFDEILDLRANYYEKFYTPNKAYYSAKFIKNGKTVSHWAKAYRGLLTRACAQNNIESIDQLLELEIEGLEYLDTIEEKKYKHTLVYALK